MQKRNYLTTLLGIPLAFALAFIAFNWLVDPFGIWNDIRLKTFNALKPEQAARQRISEMGVWARHATPNLILGTSRADIGLDPGHPGFVGDTYNLGISSQPLEESRRLLEWAGTQVALRQVVFATDFFTTNALREPPADYTDGNFERYNSLRLLTSIDTLQASIRTVKGQSLSGMLERGHLWGSDGRRYWSQEYAITKGGHRKLALDSEKYYLSRTYLPPPAYTFAFTAGNKSAENDYRRIFSFAHRKDIDLRVLVSPSHARQWEVINVLGLWPQWEEWKRMLVRINDEEARKAGKAPFPLWDFSGHNSITSEEFPVSGDVEAMMNWYWDSSHYKKAAGDLVLDRIFARGGGAAEVPPDFGVLLSDDMLEQHLQQLRLARDRWRESHPKDVAEIAEMAATAAKERK